MTRSVAGVAGAIALIFGVVALLVLCTDRSVDSVQRSEDPAPMQADIAGPSTQMEPALGARSSVDPGAGDSVPAVVNDRVRFAYSDGSPAVGLWLRRSARSLVGSSSLSASAPKWRVALDAEGTVDAATLDALGETIQVRLSCDIVHIFSHSSGDRLHIIPAPRPCDVVLRGVTTGRVLVDVRSIELDRTGSLDLLTRVGEAGFADTLEVQASCDAAGSVFAFHRITFDEGVDVVSRLTVPGRFKVESVLCPIGWWVPLATVDASESNTLVVTAQAVPIVEATLPSPYADSRLAPNRVWLAYRIAAGGSVELNLPYELSIGVVRASLYADEAPADEVQFSLKVSWPDGSVASTPFGPWSDLLHPAVLQVETGK
ncbi:MAG: hypothetical protein K8S98_12670 [Planctomycetes bacterium]|nr:hypothetical protein [Planctomycetota bacterium]